MFSKRILKWTGISVIVLTLGYLTEDIIVTNVLGVYYCSQDPKAGSFIKQKVEYPESIYWEDNVYPGFNESDRRLMILNYLDGKRLKSMALNGDDGKVYFYSAKESDLSSFKFDREKYKNRYEQFVDLVVQNEKKFTRENMPIMKYKVTYNKVRLDNFSRRFLYADEVEVIRSQGNEVIAYNRRYMRFFYKLFPNLAGRAFYYPHSICGDKTTKFSTKVFGNTGFVFGSNHKTALNEKLYIESRKDR